MNELKASAANFSKLLGQKTEELSQKTEEIVEVQKLKNDIRILERQNLHNCIDLGEIIFEKYENGDPLSTELVEICKELEGRLSMIEALEQDIAIIKGQEVSYASQVNYQTGEAYTSEENFEEDEEFQVEYTYAEESESQE